MATLKHINRAALIIFSILSTSCTTTEDCPNFGADMLINHWDTPLPRHAQLFQYKKNSNFTVLEKKFGPSDMSGPRVDTKGMRYIQVSPPSGSITPVNADYKLIIDGKLEFKITDIVSTGRAPLGCPLKSARVNACEADAFRSINFDKSCGVPASGK